MNQQDKIFNTLVESACRIKLNMTWAEARDSEDPNVSGKLNDILGFLIPLKRMFFELLSHT